MKLPTEKTPAIIGVWKIILADPEWVLRQYLFTVPPNDKRNVVIHDGATHRKTIWVRSIGGEGFCGFLPMGRKTLRWRAAFVQPECRGGGLYAAFHTLLNHWATEKGFVAVDGFPVYPEVLASWGWKIIRRTGKNGRIAYMRKEK